MTKIDLKSMTLEELQTAFNENSIQKFRSKQVHQWLVKGVESFYDMKNIPKDLQAKLDEIYFISCCKIKLKRQSQVDETVKYLFELYDGQYIESVLMKYKHGYTLCISSQVGCKMGCTFCATGMQGFTRNLLPSEILAQVTAAQNDLGQRISNLVLMGMGEPLDNYENVMKFLKLVSSDDNLNIGMRHISLSTCGIVDKIYDMADKKLQLTLSVSLHAPNDEIRGKSMPVNKRWGVDELLKACRYYSKQTGRRISFEYAMINGVNDSSENAYELAQKLRGILCHVNLIPVNSVAGTNYKKSKDKTLQNFINILENKGFTATVRRTLGPDIEASCGQLKGKMIQGEVK
ncbi:MAG: 23S rRNA (adenine(2503)-C(2))-methyltransferase RlmN [Clostridia bacterium]